MVFGYAHGELTGTGLNTGTEADIRGRVSGVATVSISRGAFSAFYATPSFLLVGAEDYRWLKPLLPRNIVVFLLGEDGVIRDAAASSQEKYETVGFVGMAGGLKGILVNKKQEALVSALFDHCTAQNIKDLPAVHYLSHPWFPSSGRKATKFVARYMAALAADNQLKLGTAQKQITHLRSEYERLWLGFEKARRMIQGIGYKTRSVAFRLEPGERFHDPNIDGTLYRQYLPTDLAGFAGIKLFVPANAPVEGDGKVQPSTNGGGRLKISIQRAADRAVVASADIDYADVTGGWLTCSFPELIPLVHGDGILEISWLGDNGPRLALADVTADRFGDDDRRSLAMQIEKGLAEPVIEEPSFVRAVMPLLRHHYSAEEVLSHGFASLTAPGGAAGTDKGNISLCDDGQRLQTHVSSEGPSGIRVFSALANHVKEVSVQVSTTHEAGPNCLYILMAVNSDCSAATVEDHLKKICTDDQLPARDGGFSDGIFWTSRVLSARQAADLTLQLPVAGNSTSCTERGADPGVAATPERDLILAVYCVDASAEYGHCQWRNFVFGRPTMQPIDLPRPSENLLRYGQELGREIRTNKIPELASQLVFYKGQHVQNELSVELGFSPLTISEETGTLQTHPLEGSLSAAILRDSLPVGARAIKCQVGTAHPEAPVFTYILGVLPPCITNRVSLVERIQKQVADGVAAGQDESLGLQWTSVSLPALKSAVLALNFGLGITEGKDVMFAAVTAGGGMSYGWCRWYSYDIISDEQNAVSASFEPVNAPRDEG